jgi:hypothetical protein
MSTFVDALTEGDLATLSEALGAAVDDVQELLIERPWRLQELLADPAVYDAVVDRHSDHHVSPTLLFGVLAHRTAEELRTAAYVNDWTGPRARIPVFDVEPLQEFVAEGSRVTFLAFLLASFAQPVPPPVPANPLDFRDMAQWLEQATPEDRVVLLRRLGDLALFMTGVFPDRTGAKPLRPLDAERLGSSIGMTSDEILSLCDRASLSPGLDAFEALGSRWYEAATTSGGVVRDIAGRFRAARRVLNHLSDQYLYELDLPWRLAG